MDIKGYFIAGGLSFVLGWLSKHAVEWWGRNKQTLSNELTHVDEALEERFGITLPEGFHRFFDNLVLASIQFTDRYMSDPAFIRTLMRTVMNKDTAKWEAFKTWLLSVDWAANISAQVPDELKPVVNQLKEDLTVRTVSANLAKTLPAEKRPEDSQVREYVQVAVKANKISESPTIVTTDLIRRMIAESEARQAALEAHK